MRAIVEAFRVPERRISRDASTAAGDEKQEEGEEENSEDEDDGDDAE